MRPAQSPLLLALLITLQPSQAEQKRDLEELAKRSGSERAPLHIRDALSEQAIDLIHEHGQNVDLSLEGYDHDLVSRSLAEGAFEPRSFDADIGLGGQKFGRMEPHEVMHEPDSQWLGRREEENVAREALGDGVDYSLEGYDHELLGRSVEAEDEIDYSLEGYDPSLLERDFGDDDEEEIDYSLEGYDHALVARALKRTVSEGDVADEAVPAQPRAVKGPPMQFKRDVIPSANVVVRSWSSVRRWVGGWLG